ncbi:MAG TPA: adenylosuccinate lyase [Xanthobacteraceae bacterium]|nr:adenylosuccinate lyase [Xanthobacteraceae bacterium]
MPTSVFDSYLLGSVWGTDELRAIFCDETRVQKWFDYEAALALAQAELGIIPKAAAAEIAAKAKVANVDLRAIGGEIRRIKHPLVPALRALQAVCADGHGEFLHFGPTTQDVLDTGMVLQLKDAHALLARDLKAVGRALARLAEAHRATPMAGRTHGVQALPITFGHKCAIWLAEAGRNFTRLTQAAERNFVGGMTGAVGTQASFGRRAFELDAMLMARLGLGVADIGWQTARDRLADYANALGLIGGGLAKIAHEIIILSHNEIDEVSEPFAHGKVGSSTMPHKRNPVICEGVVAVGHALRGSVALMQQALIVEHERDASVWRLEWKALPECCLMTGAMLAQMRHVLEGLEVHAGKMRRNLDALGGFLMSERVMFALADKVGKQSAHELVYEIAMRGIEGGITFEQALMDDGEVKSALARDELRALLDPTTYVGLAPEIVDRVLAETKAAGWTEP